MGAGAQVVPAPVGGWNARDALEAMDPADAVMLDNWIPGNGVVVGRGGSRTQLNVGAFPVDSLIPYEGDAANFLLAAYDGNISAMFGDSGVIDPPFSYASGFTSDVWQWGTFDNRTVLLNGADAPQVFDGFSLAPMTITALATPVNAAFTPGAGTLGTATYYYRISAINANGETLASTETSLAITGPAGVNVNWVAVTGATGYKVYGRSTGAELLIATVGLVTTYLDSGAITPSGALPAANTTAVDGTLLIDVMNFKGRAFYVERDSQRVWYAQAGSFQGVLTKFDFSTITQRGGTLTQIINWTRDSGDGVDSYFAAIFSTGEVLIYQGDDPGNVNRWSIIGHYLIGAPLSRRAHCKFASTELILTKDGFQTLDEAIQNARVELVDSFGGKIFRACKSAAQQFSGNFGWSAIYYARGNLLLANIPIAPSQFNQYVKNTNTGMWCQFIGWNARSMTVWRDRLYFGTFDGDIKLADVQSTDGLREAYSDDGVAISYNALSAYQKFGSPGLKTQISSAKITINSFDGRAISLNAFADYRTKQLTAIPQPVEHAQGMWDQSPWDTDAWATANAADPADSTPKVYWRPIQIKTGYATALSIRYKSAVQNVFWYSTEFIFNQAGVN